MDISLLKINGMEETPVNAFFRLGMGYLLGSVQRCFSLLEECDLDYQEDHLKVRKLADQLKEKIDFFCLTHLDRQVGASQERKGHGEHRGGRESASELLSEVRKARRRSLRLLAANRRLRRQLRSLRRTLGENLYLKDTSARQGAPDGSTGLSDRLEIELRALGAQIAQMVESAQGDYQASVNTLITQFRGCLKSSKEAKDHSLKLIPKIEELLKKQTSDQTKPETNQEKSHIEGKEARNDHPEPQETENPPQKLSPDFELSIHHRESLSDKRLIGGDFTHLALKNPSSYLIITWRKGLKLVEEGSLLYSHSLPVYGALLHDVIYVKPLNCYFIHFNLKLYRKDIDNKPPYIYMDLLCGSRYGACFRYSTTHQRLVINKDYKSISAVDLEAKKVEIEVNKKNGDIITDFRLFGAREDRVVSLTKEGDVLLYFFDFRKKTGSVVSHTRIELIKERTEKGQSLAVSGCTEYILVEIGCKQSPPISSRMAVLQIENCGTSLAQKVVIDCFELKLETKLALEWLGCLEGRVLWVALSRNQYGSAQVYSYSMKDRKLEELAEKRVNHREFVPFKLQRLAGELYFTGNFGSLKSLSVN